MREQCKEAKQKKKIQVNCEKHICDVTPFASLKEMIENGRNILDMWYAYVYDNFENV